METAYLRCVDPACAATASLGVTEFECQSCGSLLDVAYNWNALPLPNLRDFNTRSSERTNPLNVSGVWRFRELLPFAPVGKIVTLGEGQTLLRKSDAVATYVGLQPGRLFLQYEGLNPSGSFKDNGMTAAFTHAHMVNAKRAACASTGNTSASLAMFAAATRLMRAIVFIGSGKIAHGKLAQALDHGALTIQIAGNFDDAMERVRSVSRRLRMYLVNSVNPFRLEGQKTIMYRVLEGLGWEIPDWIVVPGGNLGNVSAFGKAFAELLELQLISLPPRLAVINATGASTFFDLYTKLGQRWNDGRINRPVIDEYDNELRRKSVRPRTVASAIEINHPVNLPKALRALEKCSGVVCAVTDDQILDAKAQVGAGGFGCEPASAASVAGAKCLREQGVIEKGERVVCILTGHPLKDPDATVAYHQESISASFANRPVEVGNDEDEITRVIQKSP